MAFKYFVANIVGVICSRPTLFDGNVPILTGLDGDMWASQLLTIEVPGNSVEFTFHFTDTPGYARVREVEVVMFTVGTITLQRQEIF